jgi:hypothetical protein
MASLSDQSALAENLVFRARVRLALIAAATAVAGEAVGGMGPEKFNKRQRLALSVLTNVESYVPRFAYGCATNATVAGGYGPPVLITSSTNANPIVITTTAVHGLTAADCIEVAGHAVNTNANGGWVAVTVPTTTTLTITQAGNGVGGATGTVRKMPPDTDIAFTLTTLWDDVAGVTILD